MVIVGDDGVDDGGCYMVVMIMVINDVGDDGFNDGDDG